MGTVDEDDSWGVVIQMVEDVPHDAVGLLWPGVLPKAGTWDLMRCTMLQRCGLDQVAHLGVLNVVAQPCVVWIIVAALSGLGQVDDKLDLRVSGDMRCVHTSHSHRHALVRCIGGNREDGVLWVKQLAVLESVVILPVQWYLCCGSPVCCAM